MMTRRVILLAMVLGAVPALGQERTLPELTADEKKLDDDASRLDDAGNQLAASGNMPAGLAKLREALALRQKAFAPPRFPDGHENLALSMHNLARTLRLAGRGDEALPLHEQSLAMCRALYPPSRHPDGHFTINHCLEGTGVAWLGLGRPDKALPLFEEGLAMTKKLFPPSKNPRGHSSIVSHLKHIGIAMTQMGQSGKAMPYQEQAVEMLRALLPADRFPNGHLDLAGAISSLAHTLMGTGQYDKALTHFEQALAMRQRLLPADKFPNGHPALSISLNDLGFILAAMKQHAKAVPYFEQALAMNRRLYPESAFPNGLSNLVVNLGNLGGSLSELNRGDEALPLLRESLALCERLYPPARYPDGHPLLSTCHNYLGSVLASLGHRDQALPHFEKSLAICRAQFPASAFPDGHPHLATALYNLGESLEAAGRIEDAMTFYRQVMAMQNRYLRRELELVSEVGAFDRIAVELRFRDVYLGISQHSKTASAADAYRQIWPMQAMATRIQERRQAHVRAAGTEAAAKFDRLAANRRTLERTLQDAKSKPEERDRVLRGLADERDALERDLFAEIPSLGRWNELDRLGPDDLAKLLPAGTVFIDVIAYRHFSYEQAEGGRTVQRRVPSYVAFVLAGGRGIHRVDLGAAEPINRAVSDWRRRIDARADDRAAAREVGQLVWAKLAPLLPPKLSTVYLAADGDLARLPWAAMPIGAGRVLLEAAAAAMVPHGAFLLEHLKFPRTRAAAAQALVLGGVDYGASAWPKLPGTAVELNAVRSLAPGEVRTLSASDATAGRLRATLPSMQYAHFATHGQFSEDDLTADRVRAAEAMSRRQLGDDQRRVAAKNPLGYVGLVLSNGEVLSGLGIVDLKLDGLHLVTLSACETGLGQLTGGKGVQGLQRAFHLAGCPNVIASLWKVNDAAAAALMAKFYHELWVNRKPPIEALRLAQLTIYRHPELIPDLAGERGAPKLKEAVAVKGGASATPPTAKRTDTKLWAAFVLSGVGK